MVGQHLYLIRAERWLNTLTKKEVKRMIKSIKGTILFEDEYNIEMENSCYGECISFAFDEEGKLKDIYC